MDVTSGPASHRRLVLASVIAVAGLALAACSSGTPSNAAGGTTTTTSSHGSSSTTAGGGSSTTSGGSSIAAKLSALESNVQSVKGGTFKLTYAETSSASTGTLTFEQLPPKYLFSVGGATGAEVINTGTATYECSGQSGHAYCYSFSSSTNPFAPLLNVITGASVLTTLRSVQSSLAAKLQCVHASFSNQTFAGQSAQCVSGTYQGNSFKYCVTNSGVLAYAGGSGSKSFGSISLTSYSTSASASDFALPPGSTVVTLPSTSTTAP
jgi:hypothetical protein